jgi:hypothetical protein
MRNGRLARALPIVLIFWAVTTYPARAQQIHRNGFESTDTFWAKGTADAPFREIVHDITDATAHTGQRSEHLQLSCEPGKYVYYFYSTAKAVLNDDLNLNLWVKANRPGIQLLARLVLPKERNPENLDEPLTALLRGDLYQEAGRWHRLELRLPVKLAQKQQQLMRAELQRDVDFTDAYVDRVVLNVYGGPGLTELWIDDLEIGPVAEASPFKTASRRPAAGVKPRVPGTEGGLKPHSGIVGIDRDQLSVNGKRFFFHGVRYTDTPLKVLRDAGLNTIWCDRTIADTLLAEAANLGLWIVPVLSADGQLAAPQVVQQDVARFMQRESILFWDLGGGLVEEQSGVVGQVARLVRSSDPGRPVGADAWDGFRAYSRSLDLLGAHRWPLQTGLELPQYREWLNQRRLLARSGVFLWTWIQTHLPDWYTTLVYDQSSQSAFSEPIGPQPEQIRLLTYTALAAGCRGIGFWSDRFLADSHQGRDRLLALGLLNMELKMLEPLLVSAEEPNESTWIATSIPEVKAAVLRTAHGVLVIPMWLGSGAQFVPGQSATTRLTINVPQVPASTQAWEISPGEIRSLQCERVPGGTRVKLPEFGLTTAIVFTSELGPGSVVARFQEQCSRTSKLAAQWAHDLAEEEIRKALVVHKKLVEAGHRLPDGEQLVNDANRRVQTSVEQWKRGNYREAYAEAERAVRPLRILMRAYWEDATRELDSPVASPYAVSYYTLDRHWKFMESVRQGKAGANMLPYGDFEITPDRVAEAWLPQETTLDDVELVARRVTDSPKQGQQCLMLQVKPKNTQVPPPAALERTFLAINSPTVRLQPGALVQISGWVRIPAKITGSVDGALLYDSAGGEPLAVRLTEPMVWKKFTLYRQVPASGTINVTLALTGLGTVYFDDIRIEPLLRSPEAAVQP